MTLTANRPLSVECSVELGLCSGTQRAVLRARWSSTSRQPGAGPPVRATVQPWMCSRRSLSHRAWTQNFVMQKVAATADASACTVLSTTHPREHPPTQLLSPKACLMYCLLFSLRRCVTRSPRLCPRSSRSSTVVHKPTTQIIVLLRSQKLPRPAAPLS